MLFPSQVRPSDVISTGPVHVTMPTAVTVKLCLFAAAAVIHLAAAKVPGMINPGTPKGVPPSYDCAVRVQAWEFGKKTYVAPYPPTPKHTHSLNPISSPPTKSP